MSTVSTEGTKPGNVAQLITRMSQHQHQILGTGRPEVSIRKDKNAPTSARAKFYQARYSYKAVEEDELTFAEGAYIEHLDDIEDGWKRGRLLETGRVGAFPENFVTKCDPPPGHGGSTAAAPSASTGVTEPLRVATSFDSKPLTTSGNGTGGNGSKAHALASKAVRTSLVDPLQASGSDAAVANAVPGKLIKERALVKYNYIASQEDELDLIEGTYITVVNKHTSDADWYEGEYNGRRGLFPSNHVQIVSSDKTVLPPVPSASTGASGPPTPPPIKPKPAGSTPLGLIGTTPPPATSTATPPSGGSNVKLLRQQVFGNKTPPKPGDKPNFGRPKTTVFENINFGPSENDDSNTGTATSGGSGDAEPLRHLNRERPKQAKRPPSMKPSTEIEPPTPISTAPTTSFPAKEPLPVTAAASAIANAASRQSVLIPKKDSPEVLSKVSSGSDKPFRYTTHTETILSPTKSKPATPITAHHDTADHDAPVSRAEFNELKQLVERLTHELRELREHRA